MILPLQGVKVIDLSMLLPGPLCSLYLADMGAEIIKVENPRAVDGTRVMFQSKSGAPGLYLMLNRNKKAITLNLKREESKRILFKLLEDADILLEGFRPDGMDKMGIGYDELKEKFPRLIYCGISGYGRDSHYKDFAGHDANYLALSGILHQSGETPQLSGAQFADVGGGSLTALVGILAALYSREKTGLGQRIDISMMHSSLPFLSLYAGIYASEGNEPMPGRGLLNGGLPNYNLYKTKEGRFVALGSLEEMFFKTFLRAAGLDSILLKFPLSPDQFSDISKELEEYFSSKTYSDLEPIFQNKDACLSPIRNLEEIFQDQDFRDRKMIFEVEHPKYGKTIQIGSPIKFSGESLPYRLHPPLHGENNEEVYTGLGFSREEIEIWKKEKTI
jgi:alpha-methylacyl-CoA racemase